MNLSELWKRICDLFSSEPVSLGPVQQCPYRNDQSDPTDLRPRVGVVLSYHPVLFRSGELPTDGSGFYVVDPNEFVAPELLADGISSAVVQIRLVRLDVGCNLPNGEIVTATVADHFNEGDVVLRLTNGQYGSLRSNQSCAEVRIPVSQIDNGLTTIDPMDPRAIKFITTREIGATDITAAIEGNCNYIYCSCSTFTLPTSERQWRKQLRTGSRKIDVGMQGFDCRKVQWYLRRFGFLGYTPRPAVNRNDSTDPWTDIVELATDGNYGLIAGRSYKDFTLLARGGFRNQLNQAVTVTYKGAVGNQVDFAGISELLRWEAEAYRVDNYHGLFDIRTAALNVQAAILYNAIINDDQNHGYLTLGTPVGRTSFQYDTTAGVIANEIRCAIKLFREHDLALRLHDADPYRCLDDAHMYAALVTGVRSTVAAIRLEQVIDFTGNAARDVMVHSGFRSQAEQQTIYDRGRTTAGEPCQHGGQVMAVGTCTTHPLGIPVSNAQPGSSWHNFGCAVDVVFCNALGQPTWPDGNNWAHNGTLAQANGLTWGGTWTTPDLPHMQHPAAGSPSQAIRNAYNNTQGSELQKLQAAWALL